MQPLLNPQRVWSRSDVLDGDCVPRSSGVYAWYFREIPTGVPTDECVKHGDLTLLYVGIAPKEPPKNGTSASARTLRSRIRNHMRGNAYCSTLRLTIGCLLADQLGLQLRRVGSGKRMTFADGESTLSTWMDQNAFVCWMECERPWVLEREIIGTVNLPLNLDQNSRHPYCSTLRACRAAAKARARSLPVVTATIS
jgi:hypothetical protein